MAPYSAKDDDRQAKNSSGGQSGTGVPCWFKKLYKAVRLPYTDFIRSEGTAG